MGYEEPRTLDHSSMILSSPKFPAATGISSGNRPLYPSIGCTCPGVCTVLYHPNNTYCTEYLLCKLPGEVQSTVIGAYLLYLPLKTNWISIWRHELPQQSNWQPKLQPEPEKNHPIDWRLLGCTEYVLRTCSGSLQFHRVSCFGNHTTAKPPLIQGRTVLRTRKDTISLLYCTLPPYHCPLTRIALPR